MNTARRLKLIGIVPGLLGPIQTILATVIPDFIEEELEREEVRTRIVDAADAALTNSRPEAKIVPDALRRRIIRRLLDVMLDEIVLPD